MLSFEHNQYSEHRVKTFESRYFKKAKGQNVKEVFLTDNQLDDVYKNPILMTAMKEFCLRDSSRLRQHPQAPNCPAGMQYLQGGVFNNFDFEHKGPWRFLSGGVLVREPTVEPISATVCLLMQKLSLYLQRFANLCNS